MVQFLAPLTFGAESECRERDARKVDSDRAPVWLHRAETYRDERRPRCDAGGWQE